MVSKAKEAEAHTKHDIKHIKASLQHELEEARKKVGELSHKIKEYSEEGAHEVIEKTKEHPVAALGIAAGIGLILGMLIKS